MASVFVDLRPERFQAGPRILFSRCASSSLDIMKCLKVLQVRHIFRSFLAPKDGKTET